MKKIYYLLFVTVIMTSCKINKDYLSRGSEDKTLYEIVKRLNKERTDTLAIQALPLVYHNLEQIHLKNIQAYQLSANSSKWDKIASEYNTLQSLSTAINQSINASALIKGNDYLLALQDTKLMAADDHYQQGLAFLSAGDRVSSKKAYNAFKKADGWVSNYKDSRLQMTKAYEQAMLLVVINPVQNNSFYMNTGYGNTGSNYMNENFQQNLVSDLGGQYADRYPAKFYTDWEANQQDIDAHWVVDVTVQDIQIPRPVVYNYLRNVSKQIENGKDSTGKKLFTTVNATLHIQRQSFSVRGQMDMNITDMATRQTVGRNSFYDDYNWRDEYATYTGDKRALDNNDWTLINNGNFRAPGKDVIMNDLYRNLYAQIRNNLGYAVNW